MSQLIVVLCLYESISLKAFLTEKTIYVYECKYVLCLLPHLHRLVLFFFILAYELHDLHIIFINTLKVVVCP